MMNIRAKMRAALKRDLCVREKRMEKLHVCDGEILKLAVSVLKSPRAAALWLSSESHPIIGLNGKAPIDMLGSEEGRDNVRRVLLRMDYGIPP